MDDNKRSSSLIRRAAVVGTIVAVAIGGVAPVASASKVSPMRARGKAPAVKHKAMFKHHKASASASGAYRVR